MSQNTRATNRISGRNAAIAVFEKRPGDIVRAWLMRDAMTDFAALCKRCARSHIPYHVTDARELEAVSKSTHHEGIVIEALVKPERDIAFACSLAPPACVLALDRVANPHNLGAIARSAAHFGAGALVLAHGDAAMTSAALRVAEGAGEHIEIARAATLLDAVSALRASGFYVISTSSHSGGSLFDLALAPRVAFLVGAESDGLSHALIEAADTSVAIAGTGAIESLNVASASSVLLAEWWRRARSGR